MELHKALKHIVDTEGPEIIKDLRLVNILDDFKAYEDIPASKYTLRAIIADGYAQKLLDLGNWDNQAVTLTNKFASITGFIPENVDLIFQSLAFGLGWFNDIIKKNPNPVSPNLPLFESKPLNVSKWKKNMTYEEEQQYIYSLLDYDSSKEKSLNVKLENISFEIKGDDSIEMQCEFRRIKQIPGTGYAWLRYALYDLKGKVKLTGTVGCINNNDINPKPIIDKWLNKLHPKEISKIRIYWEE